MRRGNLIVLLVALVMGGIAAYMARNLIEQNTVVTAAAPTGTIVVATIPLGFGVELTRDNVSEIAWAVPNVPEGAFASKDELFKDGRRVALTPMERAN